MSTILTAKKKSKSYISALETYARQGNGRKFQQLTEQIDWEAQSPALLRRAIDLALSMDLARLAINLAQKGKTLFPYDEELQNAARVLQPPTVRVLERSPSSVVSSMEWVKANAAEYKDKWIAVRNGKLIADALSFDELTTQISLDSDTLVTKVL